MKTPTDIIETDEGKNLRAFNMKLPSWVSTFLVISLIIMLALTVNHSLEKDMASRFGRQQLTIAKGVALGIEDLIASIENSAMLLSRLSLEKEIGPDIAVKIMPSIYGNLMEKVRFIAKVDDRGMIQSFYPPHAKEMIDKSLIRAIKEIEKPYIYHTYLLEAEHESAGDGSTESIIISIPTKDREGKVTGAIITTLSLDKIIDRFATQENNGATSDLWLVDNSGFFIIHPNEQLIGKDVKSLTGINGDKGANLKEVFLKGEEGYGEYSLKNEKGDSEKRIVAYAPVNVGTELWSVAISTPYGAVISSLRKAFINILIGAMALIIVVIITAISMAYTGARQLRLKEELKHLKEKQEWQDKLIEEHKTIEGIIEGSPIPTFVLNKDHTILYWNNACSKLTGYGADVMVGTDKHYLPFYGQERPVIAQHIIDSDFEGLKKYYGTKEIKKSEIVEGAYEARDFFKNLGGKSRHLYFLAAPIYDKNGEIIAAIETLQDISEEVILANNLKEYTESLRDELALNINLRKEIEELYAYLQSMVRSLPAKFFDIGSDGIIRYVSSDIKKNDKEGSITIKGKHFLEFVDPENRELVISKWEDAKRGIYAPYEIEARARDGSKRHLLLSAHPMKEMGRLLFVQRDITEFKTLENKLYESRKLAAVGQLSAGIAHEVRNPLSSIKMSLQILEKRMNPSGNNLKRFKIAMREVDHLEKLVNDILIYARPAPPKMEQSDIRKILEHALEMTEKARAEKEIHVQINFDENAPPITVDRAMMEHLFINTCHNAIDAMASKGNLTISTKFEGNGTQSVIVKIEDNGCGIDAEDLPHLFNPFFTRKKYGTGLGLTQVKKIIDLHQGSIKISSKRDKGTTVTITIPVSQKNVTSGRIAQRN